MVLSQLWGHQLDDFLLKLFAAEAPDPPEPPQLPLSGFLQPSRFHPALKFLASPRAVVLNAVLTQQAVHPNPTGPVLGRGQIPAKAAPGVGQETVLGAQQAGAGR